MARIAKLPFATSNRTALGPELTKKRSAAEQSLTVLLNDDIFPSTPIFPPTEAHAYAMRRTAVTYDATANIPENHLILGATADQAPLNVSRDTTPDFEDRLDHFFWSSSKVIIIEGEPSCGKSTLLQYYFRSHCPYKEEPGRRDKFDRKLILTLDFRAVTSSSDIQRLFWAIARQQLSAACARRSIDLEDVEGCDFYEPQFNWKQHNAFHVTEAARLGMPLDHYKLNKKQSIVLTDEQWTDLAFRFFQRHPGYFPYIVLVFDNLDQSPLDVQAAAVAFALVELKQRYPILDFWKLVLPLWPSSLPALHDRTAPLLSGSIEVDTINLPGVDIDEYFARRFTTSHFRSHANHSTVAEADLEWAFWYIYSFYKSGRESFFRFFNNVAGSHARLRRELLRSTLLNERLLVRYSEDHGFKTIGAYSLFDAMLKGVYPAHHRQRSPIANVFYAALGVEDERYMLIGLHFLFMLAHAASDIVTLSDMTHRLSIMGHSDADVHDVVSYFQQHGVVAARQTTPATVAIRRHVVKSYLDLLTKSAYIENMALATPVSTAHRDAMKRAAEPGSSAEFFERKHLALTFIDALRLAEREYCDRCKRFSPPRLAELTSLIQEWHIPGVFQTIAIAYNQNLAIESQMDLLPRDWVQWTALKSHAVFADLKNEEALFPKVLWSRTR